MARDCAATTNGGKTAVDDLVENSLVVPLDEWWT